LQEAQGAADDETREESPVFVPVEQLIG